MTNAVSQADKLLARLRSIPADFTWPELVRVLKQAGFSETSDKGGSYRTFVSPTGLKIFCHRPHPGNIVKKYLLREIVRKLDELEGMDNE